MISLQQSIVDLITEHGFELVTQPLRLEGFLKDLHPLAMAEVSSIMEVLWSGVLLEIQAGTSRHDLVQMMVLQSGLSLKYAENAIDMWIFVVQEFQQYSSKPSTSLQSQNTSVSTQVKTVHDVLSRFLTISKMESL